MILLAGIVIAYLIFGDWSSSVMIFDTMTPRRELHENK